MARMTEEEEERFRERYRRSGASVLVEAELEVLGSDYQANGYTTMAQADELGRVLELGEGHRLLDVGAGCGWPGLYLASVHDCSVAGVDPIGDGAGVAVERAASDGLEPRHWALTATGDALPFRPKSFDAVVHTDVTC